MACRSRSGRPSKGAGALGGCGLALKEVVACGANSKLGGGKPFYLVVEARKN